MMIEPDGVRKAITTRAQITPPVVLMSASHLDEDTKAFVAKLGEVTPLQVGSSLKFCVVAEGQADIYPRFGPTSEWDTAAGHGVLLGAGGQVTTPDGAPLRYGKAAFKNGAFIARGAQ
jgi:3'(2'), 5'-bisphosphate nucleotidase